MGGTRWCWLVLGAMVALGCGGDPGGPGLQMRDADGAATGVPADALGGDGHVVPDPGPTPDALTDAEPGPDADGGADGGLDGGADGGQDGETGPAPDAVVDVETAGNPDADADADTGPAPDAVVDVETAGNPDADADADTGPAPDADADADTGPAPDAVADAETGENPDAAPDADADAETGENPDAAPDADADAETGENRDAAPDAVVDAETGESPDAAPDAADALPEVDGGECETAADCGAGDGAACVTMDCVDGGCVAQVLKLGAPCPLPEGIDPQCGAAACDGGGECVVDVAAGNTCVGGDACAEAGECTAGGTCAPGGPVTCLPDAACQQALCDPATGVCVSGPASDGTPCDDADACTEDTVCEAGACGGGASICPCEVDADCVPSEDLCAGDFRCVSLPDGAGRVCEVDPATVTTCADDDDPCTQVACDPATGLCEATILGGQTCDDADACTLNDRCADDGTCGGQPRDCADLNPCSIDGCDAATGLCTHAPGSATRCDDGDPCTAGDTCASGVCGGDALDCDDGDPCTSDACDPGTGACAATPLDGGACDDGSLCTVDGVCVAGVCVGEAADCDDGDPCTTDSCSAATGCLHLPWAGDCDDGDPCTGADHCAAGVCAGAPLDCSDDVACTKDGCEAGECVHTPDAMACDDGNPCTDAVCDPVSGCANPPVSVACDDGDPCTLDDACGGGVCLPGEAACNDGVACTVDHCGIDGVCVHTPHDSACDDGNACTSDGCDPALGCASTPDDGAACDDGSPCTDGDACGGGVCQPGANTCECDVPADCGPDDPCAAVFECAVLPDLTRVCLQTAPPVVCPASTEPCQVLACDSATGMCEPTPALDDTLCPDNDPCTTDERCQSGLCSTSAADCDDAIDCTLDACAPESGCTHAAVDADCTDAIACTVEVCDPSMGCRTTPNDGLCGDDVPCTEDICTLGGCVFEPRDSRCEDGAACSDDVCDPLAGCLVSTDDEACDDGNPCTHDSCVAGAGCTHTAATGACDDGDLCTVGDSCVGGVCSPGPAPDCDDGNPCTSDACALETGSCVSSPISGGLSCDDGDPCTTASACDGGACAGVGEPCDDGHACTQDVCTGDACTHTPADSACDDGNPCKVGTCSAEVGCVQVARPDFVACDDATAATAPDLCVGGLCVGAQIAQIPLSGTATCAVGSEGTIKATRFGGAYFVLTRYLLVGAECEVNGSIWSVVHRLQGAAPASTLAGTPIPGALTGIARDLTVGVDGDIGRIHPGSSSVDFVGSDVLDGLTTALPLGSHSGVWSAALDDAGTTDAYFVAGRDGAGIRVVRCDRQDVAGVVEVSCGELGHALDSAVVEGLYPRAVGGRTDAGTVTAVAVLARGYGGGASVLLSDGDGALELEHLPGLPDMHDVAFVGAEPWIVGDNGAVRRRTATGWVPVGGPASSTVVATFGIATNSTHIFLFGRAPGSTGNTQATLWILPRTADPDAPENWTEIAIADNHEAYGVHATDHAVIMVGRTLEAIPESRAVAWQLSL
jgi:hypothetical protein